MSVFRKLRDLLEDQVDDPCATALEILQVLRNLPSEVADLGICEEQWAPIAVAVINVAESEARAFSDEGARRRRDCWPEMKARLESHGCSVVSIGQDVWRVKGPAVSLDISLATGLAEHSHGDLAEQLPSFGELEDHIVWTVTSRRKTVTDLARRKERRRTHYWHNTKKVWLPRDANGEVVLKGR